MLFAIENLTGLYALLEETACYKTSSKNWRETQVLGKRKIQEIDVGRNLWTEGDGELNLQIKSRTCHQAEHLIIQQSLPQSDVLHRDFRKSFLKPNLLGRFIHFRVKSN